MNYEEAFKNYENGTATEEEKAFAKDGSYSYDSKCIVRFVFGDSRCFGCEAGFDSDAKSSGSNWFINFVFENLFSGNACNDGI